MKVKTIIISIIILILTFSSLFLKIIPCKSWIAMNTGAIGTFPHNTFCNLDLSSINYVEKIYYYITTNSAYAFLITLLIFSLIIMLLTVIISKIKSRK